MCAKETRDLVIECCVGKHFSTCIPVSCTTSKIAHLSILFAEFIHLISSEANEICEQESKKTIAPEHIINALKVRPVTDLKTSLIDPLRPAPWIRFVYVRSRRCPERSQTTAKGAFHVAYILLHPAQTLIGSGEKGVQV